MNHNILYLSLSLLFLSINTSCSTQKNEPEKEIKNVWSKVKKKIDIECQKKETLHLWEELSDGFFLLNEQETRTISTLLTLKAASALTMIIELDAKLKPLEEELIQKKGLSKQQAYEKSATILIDTVESSSSDEDMLKIKAFFAKPKLSEAFSDISRSKASFFIEISSRHQKNELEKLINRTIKRGVCIASKIHTRYNQKN